MSGDDASAVERKLANLPDECGPAELAECVVHGRGGSGKAGGRSHLSDDEVPELVRLCHRASLASGGRGSPRFRVCAFSRRDAGGPVLTFEDPCPVTVEELRGLAPAVRGPRHALRVVSRDGTLVADGVVSAVRSASWLHPEAADFWLSGGRRSAVIVAVDAPRELRVSEGTTRLRLAAGEIARLHPVDGMADRLGWFDRVVGRIVDRLESEHPQDALAATGIGPWVVRRALTSVWSDVLSRTASLPQAGMLVLLPPSGWRDAVEFRYEGVEGVALAEGVHRYLDACVEVGVADGGEQAAAARGRVLAAQQRLLDQASTLATLARMEGCVGLTGSLAVHGFGGEITVSAGEASKSASTAVAWGREEPREFSAGEGRTGRGERQAYRLCRAVPNAAAFVAVRPGKLAAFSSDDEHVRWTTDLSAIGRTVWGP